MVEVQISEESLDEVIVSTLKQHCRWAKEDGEPYDHYLRVIADFTTFLDFVDFTEELEGEDQDDS